MMVLVERILVETIGEGKKEVPLSKFDKESCARYTDGNCADLTRRARHISTYGIKCRPHYNCGAYIDTRK